MPEMSSQSVDIAFAALDSKARAGWAKAFELERQVTELKGQTEQYYSWVCRVDRAAKAMEEVLWAWVRADTRPDRYGASWRTIELLTFHNEPNADRDDPKWLCDCGRNTWEHGDDRELCVASVLAYRRTSKKET